MIQEFVDKFLDNKMHIRAAFAANEPASYNDILHEVLVAINPLGDYCLPDPEKVHSINDGDYQGTLVFVIPAIGYQPDEYWYVKVYYGSCSGCDTLQRIRSGKPWDEDTVTEQQLDDYMTLALHIVQGLRKME